MVKRLVLSSAAAVVLFGVHSAFSQIDLRIGTKGGISISSLAYDPELYSGSDGISTSSNVTAIVGGIIGLSPTSKAFLQLEPRYLQKANSWNARNLSERVTIHQFELPILLIVRPFLSNPSPYALVGPNVGLLLAARDILERSGKEFEQDIRTSLTSFDLALDFGIGMQLKHSPGFGLTGDVRYSLGLNLSVS